MDTRRILTLLALSLIALTGCLHLDEVAPSPRVDLPAIASDDGGTGSAHDGSALAALDQLDVKGRAPKTGYDRDSFAWRDDVDGNGCDTRNDILRRDLDQITVKPDTRDCVILRGILEDPYSGQKITFDRAHSRVDIDHVVALSDAWQSGAFAWDDAKRRELANDPLNLLAVDAGLNRQKGDADAATWLPPNKSFRCDYVARQIAVKAKYGLWVKPAEADAMRGVLKTCPDHGLPTAD